MKRSSLFGLALVLLLTGLPLPAQQDQKPAGAPEKRVAKAGDATQNRYSETSPTGARRTVSPNAITSLPMSNPFCYQPDPAVDACYVNVRYAQANDDGAGNILAYVKITIDGRLVAKISAFFESFVYFDYTMVHGTGCRVPCGLAGASGSPDPAIGKIYTLDVRAYDVTNTWVLDDQMPVGCPAFIP